MDSTPVLTPQGMRAWERASWAAGVREQEVIARVGSEVARGVHRLAPRGHVLLLAGKGHNGDDVRAALPHLPPGQASLLLVEDPAQALPALSHALQTRPALVVDGLFGIGLNRPLSPHWIRLVERINDAELPVLAVDVPSGMNAADGQSWGAIVRATETLVVGAPKSGLLAGHAARFTGRIRVTDDVGLVPWAAAGIPDADIAGHWGAARDFSDWPPRRPIDAHKGSLGHVLVVAGSVGYHGAAVLAARAALRANPGLVTVWTHPQTLVPVACQLASPIVQSWEPGRPMPASVTCVVAGPGLAGPGVEPWLVNQLVEWWSRAPVAMVADASALDFLPRGRTPLDHPRVLTPHPGEAARLLGTTAARVQADRAASLRELQALFDGAWIVLKGHATMAGRTGRKPWWNSTGNPWLAQGGSGDVLAGFLGGLLAQPVLASDPDIAVRAAIFEHGAAADRLMERGPGWTTEDLVSCLTNGWCFAARDFRIQRGASDEQTRRGL